MSILIVPTFTDPSWHQITTFEGQKYNLQFDFNERGACWYLSIADADGVDIANGIKLVTGFALLKKCKDPRRPPGELFVFSSTPDLSPPGLLDLDPNGGRCSLTYLTSDWVEIVTQGGAGATALLKQLANPSPTSTLSDYGQS